MIAKKILAIVNAQVSHIREDRYRNTFLTIPTDRQAEN